jgi:TPR repeat protein
MRDQGLVAAQGNCGISLANDKGVSKNQEEAAKYFRLMADQNMQMLNFNMEFAWRMAKVFH